jgi:hypothetical protein
MQLETSTGPKPIVRSWANTQSLEDMDAMGCFLFESSVSKYRATWGGMQRRCCCCLGRRTQRGQRLLTPQPQAEQPNCNTNQPHSLSERQHKINSERVIGCRLSVSVCQQLLKTQDTKINRQTHDGRGSSSMTREVTRSAVGQSEKFG